MSTTPRPRSPMPGGVLGAALGVGLLCLALTGLVALLTHHAHGLVGDEPFYVAMAQHPRGPHNFPYAYRIGVPWLVHVLPFSTVVSFTILGLLAVWAATAALFALLCEFEVPAALAGGLTVGFALCPVLWVVIVGHFISIDPASILVMILGVLLIVRRQRVALFVVLTLGTLVRESTMFLVPLTYLLWARRPIDAEALRDAIVVCVVPVIVYILLRTQIDAVDKAYIPGYSGPFLHARIEFLKQAAWGVELPRVAYTYGPLWLAVPLAAAPGATTARERAFLWRGLLLLALCVISLTYAYDWDRVLILAAPWVYVGAGVGLRGHRRLALWAVIALLTMDVGYGVYLQVAGIRHGIDTDHDPIPLVR